MKKLLALGTLILCVSFLHTSPPLEVGENSPTPTMRAWHCQVPCGIYSDKMRIDMLMEDCATIEKAMTALIAMDGEESPSNNQMVRWIMAKDQHAQSIQDTVAAYWLAQRIKEPKDAANSEVYVAQLRHMHRVTVLAMKCKQTTDKSHVESLRKVALEFSASYFSAEDLKHIHSHHDGKH